VRNCDQNNEGVVHQYSYKPNPVFHGGNDNNLYMGFELEMSYGDDPDRMIIGPPYLMC
jgi:hypothetical protein